MVYKQSAQDIAKTALVKTIGRFIRDAKSPESLYGDLFHQVQMQKVFSDGKTFVDLVPQRRVQEIMREYELLRNDPNFNIGEFVTRHFYEFAPHKSQTYVMSPQRSPRQHVSELWPQLLRRNRKTRGSLLALPYPYIVPGGRFSEQFYWDSYFIMLGLAADSQWDMIDGMMKNYAYMLKKYGFIPTANRTYFLTRSQPPFFSHMVTLAAQHYGKIRTQLTYLPHLLTEYRFWMKGASDVRKQPEHSAHLRVVHMPSNVVVNRYYDNQATPRPESQREDIETAATIADEKKAKLFLDLRAGAESGWDFSSRWFEDKADIRTIHTTDIIPIDLNCLLYDLELLIADIYTGIKQPLLAQKFKHKAQERYEFIQHYCWNDRLGTFCDYDFIKQEPVVAHTAAAFFALHSKIATPKQVERMVEATIPKLLRSGGLLTTQVVNGQQWDAPNGWAPLQWIAIKGLQKYGYTELADTIAKRWMQSVEYVFSTRHKMIEKYDIVHASRIGGGGEYPLQDGFGWTNGVYAALYDEYHGA